MKQFTSSFGDAARLWVQMSHIGLESQMVIGLRMAGMMGILPQAGDESRRMVTEKLDAVTESGQAMAKALTCGKSVEQVLSDGLKPFGRRTRANARRLTRSVSKTR